MAIESMQYWIESCDIDGYRMDAAWGIRQRTPDFWPRCVAELRRTKKDLYLLAEASALDSYYVEAGFDAAYDWTENSGSGRGPEPSTNRRERRRCCGPRCRGGRTARFSAS